MFTFTTYQLRPATEADRELCERWIEADPDHRGRVNADFFIKPEPGVETFVLEDAQGEVFFFRMMRALRIDIQFGPSTSAEERERTRLALMNGFDWLKESCGSAVIRQVIFESQVVPLVRFCEKRFGFQQSSHELVCGIAAPKPQSELENSTQQ